MHFIFGLIEFENQSRTIFIPICSSLKFIEFIPVPYRIINQNTNKIINTIKTEPHLAWLDKDNFDILVLLLILDSHCEIHCFWNDKK